MHQSPCRRSRAVRSILVLIGLLALAGCQEDEITHAIVPRTAEPENTRLIGVIYPNPHADQTWFFKMMGPESAYDGLAEPFDAFMKSVRFTDKADAPLTWTLPQGWKQVEAPHMVNFAFRVEDRPLKFTISMLPKKDKDDEVFANVNRWRGQLGLEAVDKAGLAALRDEKIKQVQDQTINGDPTTLVDMTGVSVGLAPARPAAAGPALTYQKPEGWVADPHPEARIDPATGIQVPAEAIFTIEQDAQKAEVTVTAGVGGDLEANVARWGRQIGAPPVSPDDLKRIPKISVANRESPYIDLKGEKERTLGVIVTVGGRTWFFKLKGPADLVEKQKSTFEGFLKSVKFEGGMGGEQ